VFDTGIIKMTIIYFSIVLL